MLPRSNLDSLRVVPCPVFDHVSQQCPANHAFRLAKTKNIDKQYWHLQRCIEHCRGCFLACALLNFSGLTCLYLVGLTSLHLGANHQSFKLRVQHRWPTNRKKPLGPGSSGRGSPLNAHDWASIDLQLSASWDVPTCAPHRPTFGGFFRPWLALRMSEQTSPDSRTGF